MNNKIKVIVKKPQENPQIMELEDTLKTWQEYMEGYIEIVPLTNDNQVLIICNEEGKMMGLKPNMKYGRDILVGTLVFVGNDAPEFRSLTEEEIEFVMNIVKRFKI